MRLDVLIAIISLVLMTLVSTSLVVSQPIRYAVDYKKLRWHSAVKPEKGVALWSGSHLQRRARQSCPHCHHSAESSSSSAPDSDTDAEGGASSTGSFTPPGSPGQHHHHLHAQGIGEMKTDTNSKHLLGHARFRNAFGPRPRPKRMRATRYSPKQLVSPSSPSTSSGSLSSKSTSSQVAHSTNRGRKRGSGYLLHGWKDVGHSEATSRLMNRRS